MSKSGSKIREQVAHFLVDIHRLSSVRDILLPKLMSGKIDVSNIDL